MLTTPPKLIRHFCPQSREEEAKIDRFTGYQWWVNKGDETIYPIFHCPYCGEKLKIEGE